MPRGYAGRGDSYTMASMNAFSPDLLLRLAADHGTPYYLYDAETPRVLTTPRHVAYVKIAEGCDYNCAFCIIPTLRGQYRSRSVESIVTEARALGL